MNKVERLADILGGKEVLAQAIGRHPSVVTRMAKAGKIRPEFNAVLREWIDGRVPWVKQPAALDCLEPDVCPTCGQPVPHGAVL